MKDFIRSHISAECPWRDTLHWFDSLPSTNTQAKLMAQAGSPQGTVVLAGSQTGGRGRLGRSFLSPAGGMYLSAILRPGCPPEALMHLTCAAAVAMCRAVFAVTGLQPGIKWTNDLMLGKKKLGGILTELSLDPKTGLVDFAVIGVGINCRQTEFTGELEAIATSLALENCPTDSHVLAGAAVQALWELSQTLFSEKARYMDDYRRLCITLGKPVTLLKGHNRCHATALDVDPDGGLVVLFPDGTRRTVTSGEVSIRGLQGYA